MMKVYGSLIFTGALDTRNSFPLPCQNEEPVFFYFLFKLEKCEKKLSKNAAK